jgi:hypothetical protein
MFGLDTLLFVLGGAVALPYALGPLLVWAKTRTPATMDVTPLAAAPPPAVEEVWQRFAAALARRGFRDAGRWESRSGGHAVFRALVDEVRGRVAFAYAMFDPAGKVAQQYFEIACHLQPEGSVTVHTAKNPPVFAPLPGARTFVVADVEDAELLCRLHDVACERFSRGRRPVPVPPERLREEFERLSAEVLRHQVAAGLFRDAGAGELRPTARGALRMAWRLLWPWKQLALWRCRRESAELLAMVSAGR